MALPEVKSVSLATGNHADSLHGGLTEAKKSYSNSYSVTSEPVGNYLPAPPRALHPCATEKRYKYFDKMQRRLVRCIPSQGLFKAAIKPFIFYHFQLSGKEVTSPYLMAGALRNKTNGAVVAGCDQFKKQCEERAAQIIDRVAPGSCLLIDFGNGQHTAMLIRSLQGELEYFSFGATRETWAELERNFDWRQIEKREGESESCLAVRKRILGDILEEYDFISDDRCVLLTELDCEKMIKRGRKLFENQRYRKMGFNCSRFAAKVLKSGYKHIDRPFHNIYRVQMPENTLSLARKVQRVSQQAGRKKTAVMLERKIDQCSDLGLIRQLHKAHVIEVKQSLRFRLKHFLLRLFRSLRLTKLRTSEEYMITQLEKYITRHIMGSDAIKNSLLKEIKNQQVNDERIKKLLSLLRLDSQSVEQVIKLNDPELLDFYTEYFREDINRKINARGETMMLCAVRNQSNNIVRALWKKADQSLCDKDGNTLLILAAKKGNEDVVKMRLAMDSDAAETNKYGKTALDMAKKYHHYPVVRLLEPKDRVEVPAVKARRSPG